MRGFAVVSALVFPPGCVCPGRFLLHMASTARLSIWEFRSLPNLASLGQVWRQTRTDLAEIMPKLGFQHARKSNSGALRIPASTATFGVSRAANANRHLGGGLRNDHGRRLLNRCEKGGWYSMQPVVLQAANNHPVLWYVWGGPPLPRIVCKWGSGIVV